jgi:hypothetical protein
VTPADQALVAASGLVLAALWSGVRVRTPVLAAAQVMGLLVACAVWLRWDRSVEGHILLTVTEGHGLTVADLLVLWPLCRVVSLVRRFPVVRKIGSPT